MRRLFRGGLAALLVGTAAGCAPIAVYQGAIPAPGAVTAFEAAPHRSGESARTADPQGAERFLLPGTADQDHHLIGTLRAAPQSDSLVVFLYGDNRRGFRMQSRAREMAALRGFKYRDWRGIGGALSVVPTMLVTAFVPTLDGPRDIFTKCFTGRPRWGTEERVLAAVMRSLPADLVVNTGDLVTYGERGRGWKDFVDLHAPLRDRVLFVSAPGNHERLDLEIARYNWDAAMGSPPCPERYWFALDLPDSLGRFVFLDSNVLSDDKGRYPDSLQETLSERQLAWADSVLATAGRYRFVVMHHPPISAGHYTGMWSPRSLAARAAVRRRRLFEICRRRHVTAVFAGHEHLYSRAWVRIPEGGGFWQVTTGGAGAPLHWVRDRARVRALSQPLPDGLQVEPGTAFGQTKFHYCRLVIPRTPSERPSLRFDAYEVLGSGRTRRIDHLDLAPIEENR